jgi:glucose/arabinose dehydrogenase
MKRRHAPGPTLAPAGRSHRPRRAARLLAPLVLVAGIAACSDDEPGTTTTPGPTTAPSTSAPSSSSSAPATSAPGSGAPATPTTTAAPTTSRPAPATADAVRATRVRLERAFTANAPLVLTTRAGTTDLYVAERAGRVRVFANGALGPPILDISADVTTDFEKGLLGLAFSPDGTLLYASYTDAASDTRIDEFRMNGAVVDRASRRIVLQIDQPAGNHNGGNIAFGPDGHLWIGMGDGGGSGDRFEHGQNLDSLLGDMLRIDPIRRGSAPYAIPADNPYVGGGGRPEIWISGLRNPWRWSFDRVTGDLWIGDVGQNAYEEVNLLPAPGRGRGANLQWPLREGLHAFRGAAPPGSTDPVFEYDRSNGSCSVTGGYVYRGRALPGLTGAYVYGDFCEGTLFALVPRGDGYERLSLGVNAGKNTLVSFGEDTDGELYVLALNGTITKLVPA